MLGKNEMERKNVELDKVIACTWTMLLMQPLLRLLLLLLLLVAREIWDFLGSLTLNIVLALFFSLYYLLWPTIRVQ